jgi:CRISPR-associated endonuclease/helicase Cas3
VCAGIDFAAAFKALTHDRARGAGHTPMRWQERLYERFIAERLPSALDLPTGLGKTSVMTIWLIARANGARLPRRLVYVVDRRAVVDQATEEALRLRCNLEEFPELAPLREALRLNERPLPISTLRGRFADNREWHEDPSLPAIVVGTVDMIGSRLLFSGYGVSRRMRPYHAGLLGADALVVLDEAHLVPPFAHLLRAIEQDRTLRPKDEADRGLVPPFHLLPLSATQRANEPELPKRTPFRLEEQDWQVDDVARRRLNAPKYLRLKRLDAKTADRQLAEAAWALATKDGRCSRVLVFCDRRDRQEAGGGPSALGVEEEIDKLVKGDKKAGRARTEIHQPELLVGARRVYERDAVAKRLRELGFIGEKTALEKPAFLIATSAGEVGVDIDADHLVCDLVAWERMVQRFGRVNRRGAGEAELEVFWSEPPAPKDAKAPTEAEKRAQTAFLAKRVIEELPATGAGFDGSPLALRRLTERAQADQRLNRLIADATTAEPLRPALNRALVDAWSMTSLATHAGRPEVGPWLRGWVEEEPQTSLIWRTHLPVRMGAEEWPRGSAERREVEDFFEAAPPHQTEILETETWRVADWLQQRARTLLARARFAPQEGDAGEPHDAERQEIGEAAPSEEKAAPLQLRHDDIVAFVLAPNGNYRGRYRLGELGQERKGRLKDEFHEALAGKTLIVGADFAGLKAGMLDGGSPHVPETADGRAAWSETAQFRVTRLNSADSDEPRIRTGSAGDWRFEHEFALRRDGEGNPVESLWIEHLLDAASTEDARSVSRPQTLMEHQDWARRAALEIAERIDLSGLPAHALGVAARLHDEGKQVPRWQQAFRAARDKAKCGLSGPLAKTRGPIDQRLLDGYRHEFGSLSFVEKNAEFQALPDELKDLVLHLVAAHHGFARPVIATCGCEDAPPSALQERARDVALRFARLQKCWGPWGLAWWEALLRAADVRASRKNDLRDIAECAAAAPERAA